MRRRRNPRCCRSLQPQPAVFNPCRLLRLTLLAPQVVERLTADPDVVLERVMRQPWPLGWDDQTRLLAAK